MNYASKTKKTKWEVKAPEWFVEEAERAEKIIDEIIQELKLPRQWFQRESGAFDTGKLANYIKLLYRQNKLPKGFPEKLFVKVLVRQAIIDTLWSTFQEKYEKENPDSSLPHYIQYHPKTKTIREWEE
jgi:hypothetical protein